MRLENISNELSFYCNNKIKKKPDKIKKSHTKNTFSTKNWNNRHNLMILSHFCSIMRRLEINYTLGAMDVLVSLARYNFVNRTINNPNLKVLDFGCGTGYGTTILKEKFKDVDAFDVVDETELGLAENRGIITDLAKIQKGEYDIITCFEVIEHISETEQTQFMEKLSSFLKPDGMLFISTVRKMDPPPTENRRIEHLRELTHDELYNYCSKHFKNILTFGQIDQIISTFYMENVYHFVFVCSALKN